MLRRHDYLSTDNTSTPSQPKGSTQLDRSIYLDFPEFFKSEEDVSIPCGWTRIVRDMCDDLRDCLREEKKRIDAAVLANTASTDSTSPQRKIFPRKPKFATLSISEAYAQLQIRHTSSCILSPPSIYLVFQIENDATARASVTCTHCGSDDGRMGSFRGRSSIWCEGCARKNNVDDNGNWVTDEEVEWEVDERYY